MLCSVFDLETVVLIFVYCIVLYCLPLFCLCVVFFLTSFMSNCCMTELWTYEMIYVCMYVFWLPENVGFVLLFSVIPYLLGEKKINEKTAVISSLMNQEDIYRPIILSDSCCWPSENMGFALISDSCYRSHPTAISFCS